MPSRSTIMAVVWSVAAIAVLKRTAFGQQILGS